MPKMIINDEFIENYNQKYDEKENDIELLFNWNEIPGNDNEKLLKFLNQNFGIDWVKTATIEKIDDDKTLRVYYKQNSISLEYNNDNNKVNLKIDDGRTDEFISKTKNCEIKIYDEEYKLIKRRVLNELKMNDTLSEDLFFKILDWKSPRVKGIIKKDKFKFEDYADGIRNAIKAPDDKKIGILDELYGIGIPVASTILQFIYPKFFPIIDFRTVVVLQNVEKLDKSKNYHNYRDSIKGYVLFREAIKNIAKEHPKYSLRQIDKALFAYHKYELKSKTSCGLEEACN